MSYIFDFQEVHRIQTDLGHLQQKWRNQSFTMVLGLTKSLVQLSSLILFYNWIKAQDFFLMKTKSVAKFYRKILI
jgi:hypothetical protein